MKKYKFLSILLISVLIILAASPVLVMSEILIDSNPVYASNRSLQNVHLSANTSESAEAQSFQVSQTWILSKISFQLAKINSPVGNLTACIYNTTGAYPASTPTDILVNSTTTLALASIAGGATWYNFSFSYTLETGHTYAMAIYAKNATKLDSSNFIYVYCSGDAHYSRWSYFASSVWTLTGAGSLDMVFYLYGDCYPALTAASLSAGQTTSGYPCTFQSYWTDADILSGFFFESNETGSIINSTWTPLSGTGAWANIVKNLPENGTIVAYRWFVNGTANLWTTTTHYYLLVTALPAAPAGSGTLGALAIAAFVCIIFLAALLIFLKKR